MIKERETSYLLTYDLRDCVYTPKDLARRIRQEESRNLVVYTWIYERVVLLGLLVTILLMY